ncbi:hypothetical protein JOM56_001438 [Amanita muscaria]
MSFRALLPIKHANPYLSTTMQSPNIPPVKYQILNCQGQDILVGRLKILTNTGSGHAFILRRFDTGAISATTMFRAAFPNANEHDEKTEISWIKEHYDLSGNNGSMGNQLVARLAGVWVSPEVALELGTEYSLGALINVIVDARPDPRANYRRSGKSGAGVSAGAADSPQQNGDQNAYSQSPAASPPAAKRRKDSSPAPLPALSQTTQNQVPRRSARTKSPAPRSAVQQFSAVVVPRTPKAFKTAAVVAARREEMVVTPGGSEETIVEEHEEVKSDAQKVIDHVAGEELRQQDLREQKELIERLKAQKAEEEARKAAAAEAERDEQEEEEEEEEEEEQQEEKTNGKRAREEQEAPLQFQFREPELEERQIATNSRVEKWRATKRVAWGVAAFAAGLGAV